VFDSGVTAFGAQAEVESSKPIGDRVEEFAEVMYRYLHLSDDVLRILLKDVDEYFKLGNLRRAADLAIIDACISESEEVVLVGFSMGSIVGYHILANEDESFPVKSFVTCGSPLTDPAEWDWVNRLTPDGVARWPPCLRMWANIWDERDPATSHHDWSGKFRDDAGRVVQSARSFGRAPEPWNPATAHNPFDYLTSKSLAAAVATALRVLDP
jgi:pimeloyl-ACP methyl ester carboxylesterase